MTDAVTGGADAAPRVIDVGRRGELNRDPAPNGWCVGPPSAPDRFELLGPGLGGGEGITWRARYRGGETPLTLAIKQVRRPTELQIAWPTVADVQRWEEQRRLLQFLSLDHLATVIDVFVGPAPHPQGHLHPPSSLPDTLYLVMEWVTGRTLLDEFGGIPATAATLGQRLTHLQHVAGALLAVHARTAYGTIGSAALLRDVKPDNCVLDPARGVVLVDLGTTRLVNDGHPHPGFHRPGYTAPEVLDNPRAPREPAADLYALGALAYFCVVGEDPPRLDGKPGVDLVIGRRLLAAARSARVADPHAFVDHLRLMLHPQPDERPAEVVAWATRLRELSVRRSRFGSAGTRLAVAAMVAIVGGLGLTAAALREDPEPASVLRGADPFSVTASAGPRTQRAEGLPATRSAPRPQASSSLVTITAPADGSEVRQCELIEGTSALRAGTTLVLAGHDLAGRTPNDRGRRLNPVDDWQLPETLGNWRAVQQFGSFPEPTATSAVPQRYRVDVLVVELAALRAVIAQARDAGVDWRLGALPPTTAVAASITMTRVPGDCANP